MFRRRRALDALDGDIADHIERETAENIEKGMTPEQARRQARLRFGNIALVKEDTRAVWIARWWDELRQDLRYAVRSGFRRPAYAIVVVLTLALGVGANTAIFALVDAVLLRLLPVEHPEALMFLQKAGSEGRGGAPPYPCFERLRRETSSFSGIAAFATDETRVEVDGTPEQVFGQVASGNYFEVLGIRPAAGRLLTPEDERLAPPVAVIGYGYWQRRFAGDTHVIGSTISSGKRVYTIVGVTPPYFWGLEPGRQIDLTLPITAAGRMIVDADAGWFDAVARLHPDATVEQAAAQADTVFRSYMAERGGSDEMRRKHFAHLVLTPAARGLDGLRVRFAGPLVALAVASVIVLLVACVNLGSLLLARGAARTREFGVRLALGAGTGRLARQLLTETLLLFALGGAAGLVVARATVHVLTGFFAVGRRPVVLDVPYDWRLAAFAAGLACVVTALWPGLRAIRSDPRSAAKDGEERGGGARLPAVTRWCLVSGQAALSVVLLVSAVMFAKTIGNLRAVDLGFTGTRVLTMSLRPAFPGDAAAAHQQFWRRVLEQVRSLPGVHAASLSVLAPLSGRNTWRTIVVPAFRPGSEADTMVHLNHVSDDYFRTFGIEVLAGRAFSPHDREGAPAVAVLNEAAARFYFPGRSPIGQTFRFGDSRPYEIVGVVRDHKHRSLREETPRFVFIPLWQPLEAISRITLALSSAGAPPAIARAVTSEVRAIHANTLVSDVIDVEEQIDATLTSERLLSALASAFAGLTLGLAAIGIYGLLSYTVTQRMGEFGIRMALGARPSRIASDVFREVLLQLAAGIVIGVPFALAAARLAEGLLFGVGPADPWSYLLACIGLTLVACLAAWLPARRACSFEPSELLRRG